MPGSLGHLASRFFDYLTSGSLTDDEAREVGERLTAAEHALFFAQNPKDQSHGYRAAHHVEASEIATPDLARAALLHDVGKRHSGFGVLGRSVSSILIKLGAPLTDRMKLYRDHGEMGAAELESAGSPRIVVDFARFHHGQRPATIEPAVWDLLQAADRQ